MFDDRKLKEQICAFAASNGFTDAAPDDLRLLALGGSDRRFYRVASGKISCIAMVSPPPGDEQQSWLEINRFLQSCSIAVPHVYAQDNTHHIMLVEDVGDMSMYRALYAEQDQRAKIKLYKRALNVLADMQVRATPKMQSCRCLSTRRFDYASFRAETDYFMRSFLREYCRMEIPAGLDEELHRLAATLAVEPIVFMHRDFQSQNLHLLNGRLIVIDFQTATAGLPQYDLVSLLKDAYYRLRPDERHMLLHEYFSVRARLGSPVDEPESFTRTFHLCGLQRNMQALAAFSFLGTHKKKTHFYQYIPNALGDLAAGLKTIGGYPRLCSTVAACQNQQPKAPPHVP